MKSKLQIINAACICLVLCSTTPLFAAGLDRIHYNNQDLFLSGANLAWQYFANDIGPATYSPDMSHFDSVFSQFEANGGNVMRLWLHTNGANTPLWSGFSVTGPGSDTISDLQTILDDAWSHGVSVMCCLWSFDMLRESYGTTITDRSYAILTVPSYRQSYIDNSLIPMVTALAGHPAIVAWEIFNEPEGMSDEFGWSGIRHVPMLDIQIFVNQCAGAIHRADPGVLVTNGCWDMQAGTDVDGHYNYYTDARLIAAGGDTDGTLDFYCIHYYDWAGTAHSPFLHQASYWGLDKPLVIAEFFPDCASQYCTSTPYETLYQNGYAGALGWSWTDVSPSLLLEQMYDIWTAHPADVEIIVSSDTNAPSPPAGLSATPGNSTVSLNWNDNAEGDLAGYNVYRSITSGSAYSKLNGSLVGSSGYIDSDASGGLTYYYVVTAVDTSLNESDDSNEVSATPADTIPPSEPTGLSASGGNGTVTLNWNDNTESDLDGYNVYRSTSLGSGYVKVNSSLVSNSNYIDNTVTNEITYYYVITAIDTLANEGNYSNEDSATPGVYIEILGSWVSGTSHTKENGTNRALVFIAHDEQNAVISLDSVTYGGQPMTKVIDRIVASSNTYAYVVAYVLDEAGVAAASGNTFSPTWSITPSAVSYTSVFLQNVNQTTLVGAADGNATTTLDPIRTNPLTTSDGDMVIVAATCGNNGSYTLGTGYIEGIDQTMNSTATGVTGHKSATGVPETPSADYSSSINRQVIIGFVVNAPDAPVYSNCSEVISAGYRLAADIAGTGDCYVDYYDLDTFVNHWLDDTCTGPDNCGGADFEPTDGVVDFYDFSDFANQWLTCNDPEGINCTPNW